jgi:hypothetical protein
MRFAPLILTVLTAAASLGGCGKLVPAPQPRPALDPGYRRHPPRGGGRLSR